MIRRHTSILALALAIAGLAAGLASSPAVADIATVATMDTSALGAALRPSGMTINSVVIKNGVPGQFGTYSGFTTLPVTIRDGIVLSSGSVANLGPNPAMSDPEYDPASPPPEVNSQMVDDPDTGGTPEFDAYGLTAGNIENFNACYDVAALEVHFWIEEDSQIQFDFVFASVEYPFYTGSFTDAFLVFLDGTAPENQIAYDTNGSAVQVGSSFAGLETTEDVNTAFANPHGLIHHLTTTTDVIESGEHVLIFEVGDVNDHILDSAVFITGLRTGLGDPGTDPSDDCIADFDSSGAVNVPDIFAFLSDWFERESDADVNGDGTVTVPDIFAFLSLWFGGCS
jgi:hypothetical protein